jgi:hypothetical protein
MVHFPAVGHVYEVNFGSWVFHLHFHSETEMTLTNVQGFFKGASETVQITVKPIRRSIFLICLQEADKTTVVHLYDFKNDFRTVKCAIEITLCDANSRAFVFLSALNQNTG